MNTLLGEKSTNPQQDSCHCRLWALSSVTDYPPQIGVLSIIKPQLFPQHIPFTFLTDRFYSLFSVCLSCKNHTTKCSCDQRFLFRKVVSLNSVTISLSKVVRRTEGKRRNQLFENTVHNLHGDTYLFPQQCRCHQSRWTGIILHLHWCRTGFCQLLNHEQSMSTHYYWQIEQENSLNYFPTF